jgi:Zn finger protein HypA/HybF involved in hydrogenase expression
MKYNWSKTRLENTVKLANCWFDWLKILNIPKGGCNYRTLKRKANLYNIDVSHFNYDYARTHNGLRVVKNRSDKEIFCLNSCINKTNLKKAYIDRVLNGSCKCEMCGITDWNNKPLIMQLHHLDGNPKNNVKENLQLLCPNCHAQTENYSNKKR